MEEKKSFLDKIDKKIGANRKRHGLTGPIEVYCPFCKKEVQLVRSKFSVGWFIAISIFTAGWGLILYPLYHVMKSKTRCHICGAKVANFMQMGLYKKD